MPRTDPPEGSYSHPCWTLTAETAGSPSLASMLNSSLVTGHRGEIVQHIKQGDGDCFVRTIIITTSKCFDKKWHYARDKLLCASLDLAWTLSSGSKESALAAGQSLGRMSTRQSAKRGSHPGAPREQAGGAGASLNPAAPIKKPVMETPWKLFSC